MKWGFYRLVLEGDKTTTSMSFRSQVVLLMWRCANGWVSSACLMSIQLYIQTNKARISIQGRPDKDSNFH